MSNKPTTFIEIFKAWASESSFHGFPKLVISDSWVLRIFWLFVSLPAYVYCAIFIWNNSREYYEYPVVTNINRVYETQPEFPSVKFCNHNPNNFTCTFDGLEGCGNYYGIINQNGIMCQIFNRGQDDDNYLMKIHSTKNLGFNGGLTLKLYEASSNPMELYIYDHLQDVEKNHKVLLAKGMETNLAIHKQVEKKLEGVYSGCKTDYKFELGALDRLNKTSYPYFQSDCVFTCVRVKKLEACNNTKIAKNSLQYFYTNYNRYTNTVSSAINACFAKNATIINRIEAEIKKRGVYPFCADICPIECNSIRYMVTPFYRLNPSIPYALVRVYFEDFHYILISEKPKMTAEDFFGSVGGMFGLFMGCSLLSFAELAEMPLFICLAMKKRPKKIRKATPLPHPIRK